MLPELWLEEVLHKLKGQSQMIFHHFEEKLVSSSAYCQCDAIKGDESDKQKHLWDWQKRVISNLPGFTENKPIIYASLIPCSGKDNT